jgi:serine/threonine-protein kinase HipA
LIADALPDYWGAVARPAVSQLWHEPGTVSPLDRLAFINDQALGALVFEPAETETLVINDISLPVLEAKA